MAEQYLRDANTATDTIRQHHYLLSQAEARQEVYVRTGTSQHEVLRSDRF